jgi:hypothetical protein
MLLSDLNMTRNIKKFERISISAKGLKIKKPFSLLHHIDREKGS